MERCPLLTTESTYFDETGTKPAFTIIDSLPPVPIHVLFFNNQDVERRNTEYPIQPCLYKYNDYSVIEENNKALRFETRGFRNQRTKKKKTVW
jgi:hypothetical protein